MKKKLILIVPMLHQGGFERVCVTTARLMEPYFDIYIIIFNSADIAYDIKGLQIIDIKLGARPGKIQKLITVFRRVIKVRKLKKELQAEVAYSFGPTANMVNAFSKNAGTKVWLGLRGYTDIEETVKIKLFVRLADLIICCSKSIEEELNAKFHYHNTTTLYNSFDVDVIRREADLKEPRLPWEDAGMGADKDIPYLVSMGRDADLKRFWHMLKIFKIVLESHPRARLIILGEGTFEEYRKLADDLDIAGSVYFAGMQREPYIYLKKGWVYLLTSSTEGFPNALVEGMALGLAPVSVDCKTGPAEILLEECGDDESRRDIFRRKREQGELPAIWGEYGILVPVMVGDKNLDAGKISREEQGVAQVVINLLNDPVLLKQYRQAASVRAGIFTYDNYVEKLRGLIDSIL